MQQSTGAAQALNHQAERAAPLSQRVQALRLDNAAESAPRGGSWLPWALCAVLALAAGYFALEALAPLDDESLQQMLAERGLETGTVAKGGGAAPTNKDGTPAPQSTGGGPAAPKGEIALRSKGYIIPVQQIKVSPEVSGKVVHLYIKEGDKVAKGKLLAELDAADYQADHDRALAQLNVARAKLGELTKYRTAEIAQMEAELNDAKAQRDMAKYKFERTDALLRQRSASQEDYEQARSGYDSKKFVALRADLALRLMQEGPRDARIAAAEAEVQQYTAELVKAKKRLNDTRVFAPLAGIILTKRAEEGDLINPQAFSNGLSASLCEMADLANLEVELAVSERDIAKVWKGQPCRITAEAFPDKPYKGRVSRVMPLADRGKAAVPVRVEIDIPQAEAGEFLRPDMGAIVVFLNAKK